MIKLIFDSEIDFENQILVTFVNSRSSERKFNHKNNYLVGCATVFAKSEVMLIHSSTTNFIKSSKVSGSQHETSTAQNNID